MSVSKVSICNQALQKLKVGAILSLTENSKQARECNLLFDDLLSEALTARAWNFATTRVDLGRLLDPPLSGYDYKFQLPTDCLQVLEVINTSSPDGYDKEYKVEGRCLLCNCDAAQLLYIRSITDMSELHPLFRAYLTSKLAYELCYTLTGSVSMKDRMAQELMLKLKDAKVADGMELAPRLRVNSKVVDSRYTRRIS